MERHKLGKSNREVLVRTLVALLGILCLGAGFAYAEDAAQRPVKNHRLLAFQIPDVLSTYGHYR